MGLGNIKLKTGMSMLVGLSILAMVGLGGFAILEMRQQYRILAINHKSSEVDSAFRAEVQAWQSLLLRAADMTAYNQNLKEFNARAQTVDEKLTALADYVSEIGVKVDVEGHEQKLEEHFQTMLEMHQDIQTKYHTALTKYPDRSMSGWHRFTDWEVRGVDEPFTQSLQEMEQVLGAAIQADLARVNVEMALGVAIFVVAIVLASAVLIRQFTRPLVKLMDAARRMGEGDMTVRLNMVGNNEIGALARVLDNTAAGLGKLALNTRVTADSLRSTSVEMSSAVATQSRGASEQAAAVTEVTTTLEQIRDTSNTTLDKVRLLEDAANRVNNHGEEGSRAVAMTISAMEKIREDMKAIADTIVDLADQTRQIGDITGAVQTLAQQSKMLALNASIEASKAGEAGKGFAVVAGEVRHLAEQSEDATSQVKAILDQIQKATERAVMAAEEGAKTVDEGNRMVEQAGAAVAELRGVINETAQVSQQITQAVHEEATGIQQASGAMGEISRVINHFAATTQQNESAAGEVGKLAQRIQDGVSAYKVNLQVAE